MSIPITVGPVGGRDDTVVGQAIAVMIDVVTDLCRAWIETCVTVVAVSSDANIIGTR